MTARHDNTAKTKGDKTSLSLPPNRFELELEFVQALASPAYLHYLATSGILYQSAFLDFLRYLRYWKQPQYARYLTYPHCLYFLDLLVPPSSDHVERDTDEDSGGGEIREHRKQIAVAVDTGEAFRREIAHVPFRNFVHEQQFYSWQFRSARLYGSSEDKKGTNEEGRGEQMSRG